MQFSVGPNFGENTPLTYQCYHKLVGLADRKALVASVFILCDILNQVKTCSTEITENKVTPNIVMIYRLRTQHCRVADSTVGLLTSLSDCLLTALWDCSQHRRITHSTVGLLTCWDNGHSAVSALASINHPFLKLRHLLFNLPNQSNLEEL